MSAQTPMAHYLILDIQNMVIEQRELFFMEQDFTFPNEVSTLRNDALCQPPCHCSKHIWDFSMKSMFESHSVASVLPALNSKDAFQVLPKLLCVSQSRAHSTYHIVFFLYYIMRLWAI